MREKARGNNNGPSHVPSKRKEEIKSAKRKEEIKSAKRKEEIKSGTSGCGSFVVPYFQPATSVDLNAYNNVRYILYNNDVIINIVKSIVHSPVGKLV